MTGHRHFQINGVLRTDYTIQNIHVLWCTALVEKLDFYVCQDLKAVSVNFQIFYVQFRI